MLKVTLLGTGTSGGVPSLGCGCEVCKSTDVRDRRSRCVVLLETSTTRVLIDSGPDIRQQLMPLPFKKIDGVLLTHEHYDHVGGIDDLRAFCVFGSINLYGNKSTLTNVRKYMPYCFPHGVMNKLASALSLHHVFKLYPGVPLLKLNTIGPHRQFAIGDIAIMPITVMHGKLPILGYRIGDFAYITDMKSIPEGEMPYLDGVKTLVVNALRFEKPHHSHQLVADAVEFARRVGAKRTFLTHCSHGIGLYSKSEERLPEGVSLAYDGLEIML